MPPTRHDDTKLSNMCIHSIIGMDTIRSVKDACGGNIGLLTSMFEEKRKIIREQLAIVLPKFQKAYENTSMYCTDLDRKLQDALPNACGADFLGSYPTRSRADFDGVDCSAIYDKAIWTLLFDKNLTNLEIFLDDGHPTRTSYAILHQYVSGTFTGLFVEKFVRGVILFQKMRADDAEKERLAETERLAEKAVQTSKRRNPF